MEQNRYFKILINRCHLSVMALLISMIMCLPVNASQTDSLELNNKGLIRVFYEREKVLDTVKPKETILSETLVLKASQALSVFYSEFNWIESEKMHSDSKYFMEVMLDKDRRHSVTKLDNGIIFRDYKKNKTIEQQRYDLTNWKLAEELEMPEWIIADSVCNILGYTCIMATSRFRGREWTAFFSPDIPLQEGPWKLCGLPGLILKACDSKHHYSYEATGMTTQNVGAVEYFERRSNMTIKDRVKGLKYRRKCLGEDIREKIFAMRGISMGNSKKYLQTPRNYDFEETDYPHE